jgi:hypothetical protein
MRVILPRKCSRCQVLNNSNELYSTEAAAEDGALPFYRCTAQSFSICKVPNTRFVFMLLMPGRAKKRFLPT